MAKSERKWRPKQDEVYYWLGIESDNAVIKINRDYYDSFYPNNYNCFRTRSEAMKAKRAIIKVLGGVN